MSEDAHNNSEYENYGKDPEVARRREDIRRAFFRAAGITPNGEPLDYFSDPGELIDVLKWSRVQQQEEPLSEGFHGRWELLSVADVKFLIGCGIDVI